MEAIDVVILTKNSERLLDQCLQSIYENVPVKRLIVMDGFSTDNTLKILENYNKKYGNVRVISERGTRGEAREKGIKEVTTDWFMFVDSDVVLCKDWFRKASRYIRGDVGAIWGVDIPREIKNEFLKMLLQHIEARVFDIRGGCHDILIRRDVVRDMKIPSFLHTLEDAYIKEWIEARNYKVITSYDAYCRHYKNMDGLLSKENRLSTVSELRSIRFVKERLVYAAIFTFVWFLQEMEAKKEKCGSLKKSRKVATAFTGTLDSTYESNVKLNYWKNIHVDVVMLTKNSERLLRKCLTSVYSNVPINKLIVVDGYSTDETTRILEEFQEKYGNVTIIQENGTRGFARQLALEKVETDWFMFVDSDVILCDDWFAKATRLVDDNVGAVWGIEVWSVLKNSRILNLFERITMKIFEKRGGTHDLLVRRKAIENIQIPHYLHTYEDSYIKAYICKKGYRVVSAYEPYCIHFRPDDVWTIRKSINLIAGDLKFAIRHPQLLLSYAFYSAIVLYQNLLSKAKNSLRTFQS